MSRYDSEKVRLTPAGRLYCLEKVLGGDYNSESYRFLGDRGWWYTGGLVQNSSDKYIRAAVQDLETLPGLVEYQTLPEDWQRERVEY